MSKHTPGPWRCDDVANDPSRRNHVGEHYHYVAGGVGFYDKENPGGFCLSMVGSIDDARLIAAAPELLEALEGLLDARDTDWEEAAEGDPDSDEGQAWLSAIKQAYEAVRKAQGR